MLGFFCFLRVKDLRFWLLQWCFFLDVVCRFVVCCKLCMFVVCVICGQFDGIEFVDLEILDMLLYDLMCCLLISEQMFFGLVKLFLNRLGLFLYRRQMGLYCDFMEFWLVIIWFFILVIRWLQFKIIGLYDLVVRNRQLGLVCVLCDDLGEILVLFWRWIDLKNRGQK